MKRLFVLILFLCSAEVSQLAAQGLFEQKMAEYGLVDIHDIDPSIFVELKYSTCDNFVGEDMYGELKSAFFDREFARRIVAAQGILKRRNPNLSLLIYDAARPISIQRKMRQAVVGTPNEKYVADGSRGGRHNYGVAVDVTLADSRGAAFDMGTPFDCFDRTAHVKGTSDNDPATRTIANYRTFVHSLADSGLITRKAAQNRLLLIEVMMEAGLLPYRCEWWHFEEPMTMSQTRERYRLLDF